MSGDTEATPREIALELLQNADRMGHTHRIALAHRAAEALVAQAAEVERLRAALAHIVKCDQLSNLWSRSVAIEALRASAGTEATRNLQDALYQVIDDLTDPDDCWYDHHGYCQAHMWFETDPVCPHARAKELRRRAAVVETPQATEREPTTNICDGCTFPTSRKGPENATLIFLCDKCAALAAGTPQAEEPTP